VATSEDDGPRAVVTRVGRWRYRILIHDGLTAYGPDGIGWYRWGQQRAAAKASRELRRYVAKSEPERFEVR
jgi:GrpB-like predicted nucleotidyltransferase (UPF0157 family)